MRLGLGLGLNTYRPSAPSPTSALISALAPGAAQLVFHPLEYGGMFQDRAGTIPVTASGQLIGRVLDAGGGGYHATAVSDAARGVFRDVGGFRWVEYNGTSTAYQTAALPAPGVDKVQVFSGARKLSDASTGAIAELGTYTSPGEWTLRYPRSGSQSEAIFSIRDTGGRIAAGVAHDAPSSSVLTGIGDRGPACTTIIRRNGVQERLVVEGTPASVSGGVINIGSMGGTTSLFNGYHYATLGPIVRFSAANASAEQIAAAEAYFTQRTEGL